MKRGGKFLLDTDICIYTIKKKPIEVIEKVRKFPNEEICISTITIAELEYGVQKSSKKLESREAMINGSSCTCVGDFKL